MLSDASRGKDENGPNGRKITKLTYNECRKIRKTRGLPDINVRFIEHRENMGLVEVRCPSHAMRLLGRRLRYPNRKIYES
ncbi:hypothetical protein MSI_02150 [Treponema sp. JC4]|uniref:hypothetical protein n=1 Tax=Treponema sp. JC4 TaxID=1124982 RepID=UPI00025B0D51|nr:hypothetical protein [Treponema sp. JC4]EID86259.1 hypothetical protein MSI_02150 [Treponema sp. JC4]